MNGAHPTRFGRYIARRRLGSGGFASVWLAYDEQLDSPVAVKVLADNWAADDHIRARFQEEGRFLRRVESAHVVSVYDAGELEDGRPYLVMTYADQGTLADRLALGPVPLREALTIIEQVGRGLTALHSRSLLHRDIKPGNVLFRTVEEDGVATMRALVGDLGLSKAIDLSSRLTMIAGSPSYVAPEQARGERLDAGADQYSLAAIAYQLLAGRPAYAHATLRAAAEPTPPPQLLLADGRALPEVDAVLRRALAPDPGSRWGSVAEFVGALAAALAPYLDHEGLQTAWTPLDSQVTQAARAPSAPPTAIGAPPRRRSRWPLLAVAVVVLAAAATAGWWGYRKADAWSSFTDATGSLSLDVPRSWTVSVNGAGWTPPEEQQHRPALSLGTSAGWAERGGDGVFVGVLDVSELPTTLPGHRECATADDPIQSIRNGQSSLTVYASDCPGVIVERAVMVAANRMLWVQIRAADRATAAQVLDSIAVHGM